MNYLVHFKWLTMFFGSTHGFSLNRITVKGTVELFSRENDNHFGSIRVTTSYDIEKNMELKTNAIFFFVQFLPITSILRSVLC